MIRRSCMLLFPMTVAVTSQAPVYPLTFFLLSIHAPSTSSSHLISSIPFTIQHHDIVPLGHSSHDTYTLQLPWPPRPLLTPGVIFIFLSPSGLIG